MNNLPLIKFNDVSKSYPGGILAVRDLSFEVLKGEFVFIVGPSGAGKSTLARLLIRQEVPTSGTIHFEDIEVPRIPRKLLSVYRQQLGVVFQDLKLIETKTVRENVQFALEITKRNPSEIDDTTDYLLDVVNLKGRSHLFPQELSGGEKQRVAIARALANDPKLFIADEPTGNLDPTTALEILNILKTINNLGTTIIVITHDYNIVDLMQKRVIHVESGRIIADDSGGYLESKNSGVGRRKEDNTEQKKESKVETKVEVEKNDTLDILNLDKGLHSKLTKAKIDSVEMLLNCTYQDLKKIGIKGKNAKKLEESLSRYLKGNNNE